MFYAFTTINILPLGKKSLLLDPIHISKWKGSVCWKSRHCPLWMRHLYWVEDMTWCEQIAVILQKASSEIRSAVARFRAVRSCQLVWNVTFVVCCLCLLSIHSPATNDRRRWTTNYKWVHSFMVLATSGSEVLSIGGSLIHGPQSHQYLPSQPPTQPQINKTTSAVIRLSCSAPPAYNNLH